MYYITTNNIINNIFIEKYIIPPILALNIFVILFFFSTLTFSIIFNQCLKSKEEYEYIIIIIFSILIFIYFLDQNIEKNYILLLIIAIFTGICLAMSFCWICIGIKLIIYQDNIKVSYNSEIIS